MFVKYGNGLNMKSIYFKGKKSNIFLIWFLVSGNAFGSESLSIKSNIFFDYTCNNNGSNAFGLKRANFTYKKEISSELSFVFQTDVDYKAEPKNIYVKKANVLWKSHFGNISIGLVGLNMFNIQEKTWGHRFVEKTAMDKNKYSPSADYGIGFSKNIMESWFVNAMVTNGPGYKKTENDTFKKLSVQVVTGERNLTKNEGFNMGGVLSYEPFNSDSVTVISGVFTGYNKQTIRTGIEFTTLKKAENQSLISGYLNWELNQSYFVFGRADVKKMGEELSQYLIFGGGYSRNKHFTIAPNYRLFSEGNFSESLVVVNFQFIF